MIEDQKFRGYWLFDSSEPSGHWFPKSSFVVFSEEGKFWSGCLLYDYSIGTFEAAKNEIIVSDESFGDTKSFKYFPDSDHLNQYLSVRETDREPALITFRRVTATQFKSISIDHLCRIKGVGKSMATKLVESHVYFVLEVANWTHENIISKCAELDTSSETLKAFRNSAKNI